MISPMIMNLMLEWMEAVIDMPPSSSWLSKLTWRNRLTERMRSNDEWEYFKDNVCNFQGGGTGEGEAYSYSTSTSTLE